MSSRESLSMPVAGPSIAGSSTEPGAGPPPARLSGTAPSGDDNPDQLISVISCPIAPSRPLQTTEDRVAALSSLLDDPSWKYNHDNIKAIIELYQQNKLKHGDVVFAQRGQIYQEAPPYQLGAPIFMEEVGLEAKQNMQATPLMRD